MVSEPLNSTYEWLRHEVAGLAPATSAEVRNLVWADDGHVLGLSRDHRGRVEVFIVGEPLHPKDRLVAQALEHQTWQAATAGALAANRLVLPAAQHFDSVAAFLCADLLDHGLRTDLHGSFAQSEPLIALALHRATLSDQALVGLVGEIYTLATLCEASARPAGVVEAWAGSSPSSRDLQLGPVGVEVKTTTGSESEHHIQGFHQVELGTSVGGVPETHLFVLSLGIQWLPIGSPGLKLPELVEIVLETQPEDGAPDAFLDRVKQYGGDASIGYDHRRHRFSSRFQQPFQVTFERLYDLSDKRLHLLRSTDIQHADQVDASSVTFRVRLPRQVRGDLNPVTGMAPIVDALRRVGALMD